MQKSRGTMPHPPPPHPHTPSVTGPRIVNSNSISSANSIFERQQFSFSVDCERQVPFSRKTIRTL